jgi:hypothetical protein
MRCEMCLCEQTQQQPVSEQVIANHIKENMSSVRRCMHGMWNFNISLLTAKHIRRSTFKIRFYSPQLIVHLLWKQLLREIRKATVKSITEISNFSR